MTKSTPMSLPYCFCMHKHTWRFHLYQQFSWLIKMQPDWHGSTFSLKMTSCCQGYMAPVVFFFYTTMAEAFHRSTQHVFLWSLLSRLQQLCSQECMNTSLSRAVMGIDENVNSSDWMEEWMDSIIVVMNANRLSVSVWLRDVFFSGSP